MQLPLKPNVPFALSKLCLSLMVFSWITVFLSVVFLRLIGPNLMFPGISNGTHRTLFKSNTIRNVARYIVVQSFFRELEDSDSLNLTFY